MVAIASVLGHCEIIRVCSGIVGREAEDAVAGPERSDLGSDRLHGAGEVHAADGALRPDGPGEGPDEEGVGAQHTAVCAVDGRRMDPDENLVRLRLRLRHIQDPDHVW